nr:TonB-dependent receptor [uncultured Holophaga sp.]
MSSGRGLSRISGLTLALVAAPALFAQSSTTSALTGVVKDPGGKPLAGATIRLASPVLMGERTARSTENGSYRFPLLPPGPYRIVVEAPGMTTLVGRETLELGKSTTLNWKFQAVATSTVEVVATTSTAEVSSSNLTTNFSPESLAMLPAERSLDGIMNMTPGVNGNKAWGGYSKENAYMLDGMNVGDPSGNSQYIYPNMDWFSEIQMGGLGAGVEYGGFMGGYLNGIIKRGGNELEGSVNTYYGSSNWESKSHNPDSRLTDRDLAPAKDWELSASVGGPLIKDKLWYFVSLDRTSEEETPIGAPIAEKTKKFMGLAKVSWQPRESTTLEFLAEYDYLGRDGRGTDNVTLPIATNREIAPDRMYNLTWTEVLGSDKVLTVKASGFSGRFDLPTYNGESYPLYSKKAIDGYKYYNNAPTEDFNYRGRNTLSAVFDWFKPGLLTETDSHAFKFGIEGEQSTDEELERYPGGYKLRAWRDTDADDNYIYRSDVYYEGGGWNIKQRIGRIAAFVQDEWKVSDRLGFRIGLRYENFMARYYGEDHNLWNKKTFAPRLGVKYALTPDQANVINAHFGRYYAGYSTYFIDRANKTAAPDTIVRIWGSDTQIDPYNPSTWPTLNPSTDAIYYTESNVSRVDPNARQPYTNELTATFTHKIDQLWSTSLTWVFRDWKDMLIRRNLATESGLDTVDYTNPLTGGTVTAYSLPVDAYGSMATDYLVTNDKRAKRRYWALSAQVERQFANGWNFSANYTRAKLYGNIKRADGYDDTFANPNSMINSYGKLPGYNDNEIKLRGGYELPWKTRISATFTYLSGEHWTPTLSTEALPDYYNINLLPLGSYTYPSQRLLDVRVSQGVSLGRKSNLEAFVDVFNVLNCSSATSWDTMYYDADYAETNSDYQLPDTAVRGRRARVGVRITF